MLATNVCIPFSAATYKAGNMSNGTMKMTQFNSATLQTETSMNFKMVLF